MIKSVLYDNFSGGMSSYQKSGLEGSAQFIQALDISQDPNYATLRVANTKVSGSTVTDLPLWAVDGNPWDTNRYFYGNIGNLYKETSGGTWSVDRSGATIGNGTVGQGLYVFNDYLYYATSTTIGRKGKLSATPTFNDDFFTDGTINLDVSLNISSTTNTYTTPTTPISEGATNKASFIPTKDPVKEIDVYLKGAGTGNWTLTVHDANNIVIGSATVNNGSLVGANNYQPFIFSSALRIVINNTYHFHLTSTVADGTVAVLTSSDLSTANFKEYIGILVADTAFHPMISSGNGKLVIGNERYLSSWDETTYTPNAISFPPGFRCRTLSLENEFIVAGAWKGPNTNTVLDARLFYWDGSTGGFSYSKPITQGLPNAIASYKNETVSILGSSGTIYRGTEPFMATQSMPTLTPNKKIEVYPGAITEWQEKLMIGYCGVTDDANMSQGVYAYGNNGEQTPKTLTMDFLISSGVTQNSSMQIGMVKGFGKDLYIGWYDGTNYAVDKASKGGNSVASGFWQSLIFDDGKVHKKKLYLRMVVTYLALLANQSVTAKYRTERATNFTLNTVDSTVGSTRQELYINTLAKEFEFGFNLAATDGSYPKVTGIWFEYDGLEEQRGDI